MEENTAPPNPQTPPFGINQTQQNISSIPPPVLSKKKFPVSLIIGIVLFLLIAGGAAAGYVYKDEIIKIVSKPKEIACTMEAKICPDGSSVGRSGPKCEFTPCPSVSPQDKPKDETANWKTYEDLENNYTIKYPENFYVKLNEADSTIIFDSCKDCQPIDDRLLISVAVIEESTSNWSYITPPAIEVEKILKIKVGESIRISETEIEFNTYKRLEDIQLSGLHGIVTENKSWPDGGTRRHIFVKKDGKIYDIALPTYTKAEELEIFNSFASTFKFTE